jgi:hypothetical protein
MSQCVDVESAQDLLISAVEEVLSRNHTGIVDQNANLIQIYIVCNRRI